MGIKAGISKVDITPPVGLELCGYGFYLKRRSTGIKNRLYSKALIISNGASKVAIITNDLIGISKETTKTVRNLVREETGIPEDHILITCTHTHHGPATIPLRACGEIDEDYLKILPKYIAGAVNMANSSLRDAKIGSGKGYLDSISMNRAEEGGPIDPEVGVIRVDDNEGKPLTLLINFACHPTTMPINNTLISGDFPGEAASIIETVKNGVVAMFLQGACGDINPILTKTGKTEQVGVSLAAEALKTCEQIEVSEKATVASTTKNIKLPLRILSVKEVKTVLDEYEPKMGSENETERKLGKVYCDWARSLQKKIDTDPEPWLETEIQTVKIGDIVLVAQPSEMFVEFGLNIKAKSPYKKTFVVGYANDFVGYIPDEEDYSRSDGFRGLSGYAAKMVPALTDNFPFMPNVGRFMEDALIDLIQSAPWQSHGFLSSK